MPISNPTTAEVQASINDKTRAELREFVADLIGSKGAFPNLDTPEWLADRIDALYVKHQVPSPRVSLQQLIDGGLNGFGIQLWVESIRRFPDWQKSAPFSVSFNGVKVTVEPDPEGAGPARYDEGTQDKTLDSVTQGENK